jgi:predicted glycosyltransferase involved in capsule biosynthesis
VPFREETDAPERAELWAWLEQYWSYELPEAEIVIGTNRDVPFSKTKAVNRAAWWARGDIFVILDSDCYFRGDVIQDCADQIRADHREGHPLWFVPYRHIYRLTQATTQLVTQSAPYNPLRIPSPPPPGYVESTLGSMHGHRFGAMIMIVPRIAFEQVGGMDERFAGWGGEDVAFVRTLDTLYSPHKTIEADVLHLWHPKVGEGFQDRMWTGQTSPLANSHMASRYNNATGDRHKMRALINETRPWWRRQL